ncbi:MAG TPA: hypothetical protein PLM29_12385, partial [Deltaproteobacteria bacterium]|nr:hypothetical protein [Deltaproteobacteria bacterium]
MVLLCIPPVSRAQLTEITEEELSQVSAQAGITYNFGDSGFRITYESYRISDTDHDPVHWMEFNELTIDDGQGGYFSMDTPFDNLLSYYDFNTIDVATGDAGQSYVMMNLSTHAEPRTYSVGNFVFCDQDLGGIRLEDVQMGPSDKLIIGARTDGGSGIDMEYQTRIDIASIEYTYNNQPTSLVLSGIHLSQYATGSPEDPTSWLYTGKFKIGDIENNNPMTMDVGTSADNGTSVYLNIPMTGSARVEGVDFGDNRFGPCAIDGINVHHLIVQMPGS